MGSPLRRIVAPPRQRPLPRRLRGRRLARTGYGVPFASLCCLGPPPHASWGPQEEAVEVEYVTAPLGGTGEDEARSSRPLATGVAGLQPEAYRGGLQDNPIFKEFQEIFQKFDLATLREAEAAAAAAEARVPMGRGLPAARRAGGLYSITAAAPSLVHAHQATRCVAGAGGRSHCSGGGSE